MAMEGSGKLHCCSIVLLFLCGLLNTLQSVTSETKISTICNTTNSTWAMLSCSSDSWYHVIQELYSPVNTNCSLSYSNNYLQENSETGLDVSCAGPASPPNSVCSESVRSDVKDYNEALVDVTYECIPESKIYNLCLKQEVNLEGQVYLASPLMFTSPETSLFTNCSCEITGVLKAEVLYADVNSDVNITCGSWSSNEFLFLGPVVNIDLVLQDKPCTMRIIYRGDNRNVSTMTGRVWMKVSGSNMTLKYLEQPPDSVFTLSTTTTATMSTTTSSSTKTSLTTSFTSQESSPDSTVISSRCSPSSSNMMLNCDGKSSDVVVGSTVSTTLSTADTSTMSTAASSNDRPPSTTSSSRVSSPDPATISTGTETMTSTPVSTTSSSSFSTPVSSMLEVLYRVLCVLAHECFTHCYNIL
ncbi:uncharacterized serine-rich protein C215.13-like [Pomacea canaliculata]|uniref:uncharacterized serine-rich protein C215.13-like n=1 Tax=Pomacea canaliculata TaxID=400727 RepID=UPI000D73D76B|nr:uncharacterized serine-rich protein C215.13-like [Pomacea canaliculata]XP_025098210.1 uncharacterized serine-rich protein C215.13-like [Pomacea canaliculata]